MARVSHPNVVTLHDFFEAEGHFFLAMEHIEGVPLATLIRSEDRLDPTRCLEIGFQVLLGLAAAHRVSIVHRDVNPNNIMVLVDDGVAKLMDFGISVSTDATRTAQGDQVIGTANYMAPEQLSGAAVDWRCDLYGLGATLYHALTGTAPYKGLNILHRQAGQGTLRPIDELAPDISAPVIGLVGRLMANNPDLRPSSLEEAITAVDEILTGFTTPPQAIPGPQQPPPLPTRSRRRPTRGTGPPRAPRSCSARRESATHSATLSHARARDCGARPANRAAAAARACSATGLSELSSMSKPCSSFVPPSARAAFPLRSATLLVDSVAISPAAPACSCRSTSSPNL